MAELHAGGKDKALRARDVREGADAVHGELLPAQDDLRESTARAEILAASRHERDDVGGRLLPAYVDGEAYLLEVAEGVRDGDLGSQLRLADGRDLDLLLLDGALRSSKPRSESEGEQDQGEESNGYGHDVLLRWRYEARGSGEQRPCQCSARLSLHKETHQR